MVACGRQMQGIRGFQTILGTQLGCLMKNCGRHGKLTLGCKEMTESVDKILALLFDGQNQTLQFDLYFTLIQCSFESRPENGMFFHQINDNTSIEVDH